MTEESSKNMTGWITSKEAGALLGVPFYHINRYDRGEMELHPSIARLEHNGKQTGGSRWRITWVDDAAPVADEDICPPPAPEPVVLDESAAAAKEDATPPTGPKVEKDEDGDSLEVNVKGQGLVKNIEDLIRVAEVDTEEWECLSHKVNTWTTPMKMGTGDKMRPIVVRNWQVSARFERRLSSLVRAADGIHAMPRQILRVEPTVRRAVIIPDTQHGFRWSPDRRKLVPLHDRAAIDVALQLIRKVQPTNIVLLGDMLDLAPWSVKYARDPMLAQTTQPSIDECHAMLAAIRQECPTAEIEYHEGNHEDRITRKLVAHAEEALYLRAAGDDRDVLSVPRLLALDQLDIDYYGPYGSDTRWLWGKLRIQHGTKAKAKGGATAGSVVTDVDYDTVFGHVHRCETASRTVESPTGPRIITAATPGCLCRVDGAVPGATKTPNWQQGLAIASLIDDKVHLTVHPIHQGVMVYDGQVLRGDARHAEWAEATGWTQSA